MKAGLARQTMFRLVADEFVRSDSPVRLCRINWPSVSAGLDQPWKRRRKCSNLAGKCQSGALLVDTSKAKGPPQS